jgi:hypothetical protein
MARKKLADISKTTYLRLTKDEFVLASELAARRAVPISAFIREMFLKAIADGDLR